MDILRRRAWKKRLTSIIVVAYLLEELEQQQKRRRLWVHPLWQYRLSEGEFNLRYPRLQLDPRKFYDYYGMTATKFNFLLELLRPTLQKQNTKFRLSISVEERLTVCLRFLMSNMSCKMLAHNFLMGYETVRTIIIETTDAIWNALSPIVLPSPTKEMWKKIEKEFAFKWNYPNCIGAIDGKHVVVQAPRNSGSLFFNYKKTFSVVLLAVSDANYKFIVVDVGSYGRNSDGGIFSSSNFGKKLLRQQLDLPDDKIIPGIMDPMPHVFVADEAFPIHKNLMRPYPRQQVQGDEFKKVYNYRHSRARRVVEQSFGLLAQKFGIYQRRIKYQPKLIEKIILATVCLHNYLLDNEALPNTQDLNRERTDNVQNLENSYLEFEENQIEAITVREKFKQYFNNNGSLDWQLALVNRH